MKCIEDEIPFNEQQHILERVDEVNILIIAIYNPQSLDMVSIEESCKSLYNSLVGGPFGSDYKNHYTKNKEVRIVQLNNIGIDGWKKSGEKNTTYAHSKKYNDVSHYLVILLLLK